MSCVQLACCHDMAKSHKITTLGENSDVMRAESGSHRSRRSLPSAQQRAYTLDAHNLFRRMEGASNMQIMVRVTSLTWYVRVTCVIAAICVVL